MSSGNKVVPLAQGAGAPSMPILKRGVVSFSRHHSPAFDPALNESKPPDEVEDEPWITAAPPPALARQPTFQFSRQPSIKQALEEEELPGDASELQQRNEEQQQRQRQQWQQHSLLYRLYRTKCLSPDTEWYSYWNHLVVLSAVCTGWMVPFLIAFQPDPGLIPFTSSLSTIEYTLTVVFFLDVILRCCTGADDLDTGLPITDLWPAFLQYLRTTFVWDMLYTVPWDLIVLVCMGDMEVESNTTLYITLLKLIQLGRLSRFAAFVAMVEYKMLVSQTLMVLMRNILYVLFSSHVFGCLFYFIARLEGFDTESWVGRHFERWEHQPIWVCYVYALYYGITAFAGAGDPDFYMASAVEAIFMIIYVCYNILLGAYILGTITMLMVKGEKRQKQFRDRISNLRDYGKVNELPVRLMEAMEEHLELHFNSEQASDEQVLAIYPTTIRRRVLRQLYMQPIKKCPLFSGCRAKFFDAVLTLGRIETFLPRVQIIAKGDIVSEVYIVLEGVAETTTSSGPPSGVKKDGKKKGRSDIASLRKRSMAKMPSKTPEDADVYLSDKHMPSCSHALATEESQRHGSETDMFEASCHASVVQGSECGSSEHGSSEHTGLVVNVGDRAVGSRVQTLESGASFGAVSFFTEVGSHESVWSSSLVKVLSLNRSAYEELLTTFPQQTRKMLENLEQHSEEAVRLELVHTLDHTKKMSVEVAQALHVLALGDLRPSDLSTAVLMEIRSLLRGHQQSLLDNLGKVKEALEKYTRKVDQTIAYEFLNSCNQGDEVAVREALSSGMSPNTADYDHRSGLMLACHAGHQSVVYMLLDAGADPMLKDNFGGTAMFECVKTGHDDLIKVMGNHGATLGMDGILMSSQMGALVHSGDMVQLRRLLLAGANANTPDYIGVTPLHVAVSVCNLTAARILVTEGGAKVDYKDAWGNTPLDEARRLNNQPLVDFLEQLTADAMAKAHTLSQKMEFLNFCSDGDAAKVKSALALGMSPNTADYDVRTGLMLACHSNQKDVVETLLTAGADPMVKDAFGHTAMWDCVTKGHDELIDLLLQYGGSLGIEGIMCSSSMSTMITTGDMQQLMMMIHARACPDQQDYLHATPLHTACAVNNLVAVRLLVEEANATVDMLDLLARTPLDCARQLGHFSIVLYLEPLTMAAQQGRIKNRKLATLPPAASLLMGKGLTPIKSLLTASQVKQLQERSSNSNSEDLVLDPQLQLPASDGSSSSRMEQADGDGPGPAGEQEAGEAAGEQEAVEADSVPPSCDMSAVVPFKSSDTAPPDPHLRVLVSSSGCDNSIKAFHAAPPHQDPPILMPHHPGDPAAHRPHTLSLTNLNQATSKANLPLVAAAPGPKEDAAADESIAVAAASVGDGTASGDNANGVAAEFVNDAEAQDRVSSTARLPAAAPAQL